MGSGAERAGVIDVHARDIVEDLINERVSDTSDFSWTYSDGATGTVSALLYDLELSHRSNARIWVRVGSCASTSASGWPPWISAMVTPE